MTQAEFKHAFALLDRQHPFVAAVVALHENHVTLSTAAVVNPNLSNEARQFNAGRLSMALDAQALLDSALAEAHDHRNTGADGDKWGERG